MMDEGEMGRRDMAVRRKPRKSTMAMRGTRISAKPHETYAINPYRGVKRAMNVKNVTFNKP